MPGRLDRKPQYGQRLLVNVVDEYAANEPERTFVYQPLSSNPKDGFRPITFRELSNGVNHLARELLRETPEQIDEKDEFPTVAYIGPNDIRYVIVMLACIKAHHKALFISPRNSIEAQLSLFKATDCTQIIYDASMKSAVETWLQSYRMPATVAPDMDVWLQSTAPHLPYDTPFEEARWHPMLVMHTSGSTGIPKPIVVRQGSLAIADTLRDEPPLDGAPSMWSYWATASSKIFSPMPLFHMAGTACTAIFGIYYGVPMVYGVSNRPLSADMVAECLVHSQSDSALLPPSIIEDMSVNDAHVKLLANLKLTGFGGGNLSPLIGDELVKKGVKLTNVISSTEIVPYLIHYQKDPELWQWIIINAEEMGAQFRLISDDDIYEMFVCRKHPTEPLRQALFYTFPDKTEWSTGDMYKKHPTKPNHWLYNGRTDNVIVFSNGEKLNPVDIEAAVVGHPAIRAALVVGQQRFQPALILQPNEHPKDEAAREALINSVWPIVEEVNKVTVAHGRISRNMIAISNPEKPFLLSPKGSIQRVATVKLYKDFINELYADTDEGIEMEEAPSLNISNLEALTHSIVDIVRSQVGKVEVDSETDLFSIGVDSMQVLTLSKILRSALESAGVAIDKDTAAARAIYANPTISGLARHLYSTVISGDNAGDADEGEIRAMSRIIEKYTADLPPPNKSQSHPLDEGQTVIVTGTTGSLGAYMLDQLIKNPRVAKIIAFNRGEDGGRSRQSAYNATRGLSTDFSKVEFLGVDLSKPLFGLTQAQYDDISATADRIVHNAWPVNFNISVTSFEPYIFGVRQLVEFSNKAAKRVPIIFISSIGTVNGWTKQEPVPEHRLDDLTLPKMGYGRSKYAASCILDAAVEKSGISAAIIRVGQIAGPRTKEGVWNPQEFIPSLIASSVHLGMLPASLGPMDVIDWTPVQDIAGLVLDIAGVTQRVPLSDISGYFHGVNPSATSWADLTRILKSYYGDRIKAIVPLDEWIRALEASAVNATAEDAEKNPGIKLIDTYKGMDEQRRAGIGHAYLDMTRTVAHSQTMRSLGPVDEELMKNWCDQWNY
ncbi:acetyl-CoA synthetase-like protein [Trichoderma citrinoviride]|uniref:Acetyl-CoA synthetase-like protein n=1 Tax=Trichoderma citrinoviride TaxID=58853 RepID=A0A2T4BEU9_9HYPO|nr:acetyl-CoA synthetase-like protein [Trichoderma citrinoviride]PTB67771.1 acetyl-CoA synthetase-like protein [Trichoderma citrinoviride]